MRRCSVISLSAEHLQQIAGHFKARRCQTPDVATLEPTHPTSRCNGCREHLDVVMKRGFCLSIVSGTVECIWISRRRMVHCGIFALAGCSTIPAGVRLASSLGVCHVQCAMRLMLHRLRNGCPVIPLQVVSSCTEKGCLHSQRVSPFAAVQACPNRPTRLFRSSPAKRLICFECLPVATRHASLADFSMAGWRRDQLQSMEPFDRSGSKCSV